VSTLRLLPLIIFRKSSWQQIKELHLRGATWSTKSIPRRSPSSARVLRVHPSSEAIQVYHLITRSHRCWVFVLLLRCWFFPLTSAQQAQTAAPQQYRIQDLQPCSLSTVDLTQLGPNDVLDPCIMFEIRPVRGGGATSAVESNTTSLIPLVQVTPSNCGNQRDGAVTAVQKMNADTSGKGVPIGFYEDHFVQFTLTSVIAGNPANLTEDEYNLRHDQYGKTGSDQCIVYEDILLTAGILVFGYVASSISWILSIGFSVRMVWNRQDPIVKVSQIEFLALIFVGAIISSSLWLRVSKLESVKIRR